MQNKGSEITYAYSRDDVFKAIVKSINNISGMKLHSSDDVSGHIIAKTGMSAFSYGENIQIDISPIPYGTGTHVSIGSGAKTGLLFGGAADFGKNQKNIDLIIGKTSEILKAEYSLIQANGNVDSPQNRMEQLKKLLDSGLITQEEYDQKRQKLIESL